MANMYVNASVTADVNNGQSSPHPPEYCEPAHLRSIRFLVWLSAASGRHGAMQKIQPPSGPTYGWGWGAL
eukprot:959958-Prymnesium_polylepis.1